MELAEAEEKALCERSAAGDRKAFEPLVRAHQSAVRSHLRRLTHGNHALADDLAQECFLQAWSNMQTFRGDARFSSWLYRIAYHRYLMHVRSHHTTESLPNEETMAPHENGAHGTMQRLDVEKALARLNESERVAILHCYYLDLSHDEAAQILGLPLGTLKSQVLRGKQHLRELLAAWQPEVST